MLKQMNRDLDLEVQIKQALFILKPLILELSDESYLHAGHAGVKLRGGRHYALRLSSADHNFNQLSLINQHKTIYTLLHDFLSTDDTGNCSIHALKIAIVKSPSNS